MSWKHIEVRHREAFSRNENKFENMSEEVFQVHGHRNNHMDMGAFYAFLSQHSCDSVFVNLFGIVGKPKSAS